ncbi:MAG TPA: type II secretion system protein [Chthoniobacteraceae bacterium]|nr:type II secretion system protein [Chthoniobacteraceae bacterium]
MPETPRCRRSRGFTLVELLLAIGVLALLAVLVSGMMGRLRERGRTTQCASNLRQLGVYVLTYAQENNGLLPPVLGWPDEKNRRPSWYNALDAAGILPVYGQLGWSGKEVSIARCPARPFKAAHSKIKSVDGHYHYGMNNAPGGMDTMLSPDHPGQKLQNLPSPAGTFLLTESDAEIWVGRIRGEAMKVNHAAYPHQGGANLFFADGHLEWRPGPLPELTSSTARPPEPWWGE